LETKDIDEAEQKARRYLPTVKSTAAEVIAAHVQIARTQATQGKRLFLKEAWDKYSVHPGRAMPATVSEQQAYRQTFNEFVRCLELPLLSVREITHRHAEKYADFLKTQALAVDTHNRKIKRLRKIFKVLNVYCGDTKNPVIVVHA